MAREITIIVPSTGVPQVVPGPRAEPLDHAAKGLGDLAQGLGSFIDQREKIIQKATSENRVSKAVEDAEKAYDEEANNTDTNDVDDFNKPVSDYTERARIRRDKIAEGLETPAEREEFNRRSKAGIDENGRRVRDRAFEGQKETVRNRLSDYLGFLADKGAESSDKRERNSIRQKAGSHIDNLVQAGTISADEGAKYYDHFARELTRRRLRQLGKVDPDAARHMIDRGVEDPKPGPLIGQSKYLKAGLGFAPVRYREDFVRYGKEYGVPPIVLAGIAWKESSFRLGLTSPKGAAGLMQFIPGTAKRFGVDVSDPSSSIRGAAQYMSFLLKRYDGNLAYALAGYNWGEGNVDKWIKNGADFSRLPAETQDYINKITGKIGKYQSETDWDVDGFDPTEADSMVDEFDTQSKMEQANREASLKRRVEDLVTSIEKQEIPPQDSLDQLKTEAQQSGDPNAIAAANAAAEGATAARKLGRMPFDDAAVQWKALNDKPDKTPGEEAAVAYGAGLLRKMQVGLKQDPMQFASDAGVIDLAPIDFKNPAVSFAERGAQARKVAAFYRLPAATALTSEERKQFSSAIAEASPEQKEELISSALGAFGKADAMKLLSDMKSVSPAESHLALLTLYGGSRDAVARRGFKGVQYLAEGKAKMPGEEDFAAAEREMIDSIFDPRLKDTRQAVISAARALYAERVVSKSLTSYSDIDYRESLHEALGKHEDRGGMISFRGRPILIPADMTEDDFKQSFDAITDDELLTLSVGGGEPAHVSLKGDVVRATAKDVSEAYLVSSAYGRYRVSMTNPDEEPPQYLIDGGTGKFYEIDFNDYTKRPYVQPLPYGVMSQDIVGPGIDLKPQRPKREKIGDRIPPRDK